MNNLKVFVNVADAANITRAAEALHITQPAVSKAVKKLEEDLGVALFYRDKRNGLALTDTGERILDFARKMMLLEEKMYQTAYMSKNMLEGTLKIATLPYGSMFFVIKALSRFQKNMHRSMSRLRRALHRKSTEWSRNTSRNLEYPLFQPGILNMRS